MESLFHTATKISPAVEANSMGIMGIAYYSVVGLLYSALLKLNHYAAVMVFQGSILRKV